MLVALLSVFTAVSVSASPGSAEVVSSQSSLTPSDDTQLASRRRVQYTVQRGDTLSEIANDFEVSVQQIRDWNDLDGDFIREGQELVLRPERSSRRRSRSRSRSRGNQIVYVVERGDTLARIADRYDVEVSDLVSWNRGIDPDMIRIGQEIRVRVAGSGYESSSIGRPNSGRLSSSHQLENSAGFRVRNPSRSYGTDVAVSEISAALGRVAARHPNSPYLAIGDLSYARGGRMRPHVSHQSGRDADIAYYTIGRESNDGFIVATPETLDSAVTWYLLKSFIDAGRVRYIFIDYELQAVLYEYARDRGASEEELETWFQYPREDANRGLIRDSTGHDDHFHIRFRCASDDGRCRD